MQIGHRLLWYEYPLLNSKSGVSAVAVSVFPGGLHPAPARLVLMQGPEAATFLQTR